MTALTFAAHAKSAPQPAATPHLGEGGNSEYTCHMAVMHWAFLDLGSNHAQANACVTAINNSVCLACNGAHPWHSSIPSQWYGANFCVGAQPIANRAALFDAVEVGDVLITNGGNPMHSMVVVEKTTGCFAKYVYVRGFNNVGTLGTGQFLKYDNANRDIDRATFWRNAPAEDPPVVGQEVFGNTGASLSVVPYANYIAQAAGIRNRCAQASNDNWVFV